MTMLVDPNAMPLYPLTDKDNAEVEREVAELLGDYVTEVAEEYQTLPGVPKLEGRELLAYFEVLPYEWWEMMAGKYPNETKDMIRRFARLTRKYRTMDVYGRMVPV